MNPAMLDWWQSLPTTKHTDPDFYRVVNGQLLHVDTATMIWREANLRLIRALKADLLSDGGGIVTRSEPIPPAVQAAITRGLERGDRCGRAA